jgi:Arc/MetJ-type ribon-helix-helix transcriptional regulator
MSKLTFRADDELVSRLEAFDTSKSEVLREALREYIERHADTTAGRSADTDVGGRIDEVLVERIDDILAERIDDALTERVHTPAGHRERAHRAQDINVNITVDRPNSEAVSGAETDSAADVNATGDVSRAASNESSHGAAGGKTGPADNESTAGEGRRRCTQCGESLSPSHVHCPNCGEKASHRVFCDCGDELRSDWGFCPGCGRRTPTADVLDGS